MEAVRTSREHFMDGFSRITGISKRKIEEYSKQFDLLHIVDHPMAAGVTDAQYKKIVQLREFLNAYQSLRKREWEMILCAYLDSGGGVISCEKVAEGTVNRTAFFSRELLKRVLQLDAVAVVLAHNHPSSSLKASEEDRALTKQLQEALHILGIKVLDHIIVGADRAMSMYQEGMISEDHPIHAEQTVLNLSGSEGIDYER